MDAPHIEDTVTDHAADAEDIRRVIADAEKAFNAKDPDLLVEHFARNVTAVGVTGATLVRRAGGGAGGQQIAIRRSTP
jgi:ketosteroid isomerase-like protein